MRVLACCGLACSSGKNHVHEGRSCWCTRPELAAHAFDNGGFLGRALVAQRDAAEGQVPHQHRAQPQLGSRRCFQHGKVDQPPAFAQQFEVGVSSCGAPSVDDVHPLILGVLHHLFGEGGAGVVKGHRAQFFQ